MGDYDRVWQRLATLSDPLAFLVEMFARAPYGMQIYRADGHPLLANAAFRAMFGSEPPPEYNVFEDPILQALGMVDRLRRSLTGEVVEIPVHWYDPRDLPAHADPAGRRRAVSGVMFPIRSTGAAVDHIALLFRDETDLRLAVQTLEEQRNQLERSRHELEKAHQQLRRIIDTLPAFVYAQDTDGRFILANQAVADSLGKPRAAIEGHTHLEITGEPEPPRAVEIRAQVLAEQRPTVIRALPSRIYGRPAFVDLHKTVYREEPDAPLTVLTVALDVTERERIAALEREYQQVQQSTRLKSEFLANMSHELRTPLNAIIGFAELLHDGRVDPARPEHHEFIGDILSSGRHLLELVNDVLDLSKIEAGKLDLHPEPVSLRLLVTDVASVLRGASGEKQLNVTVEHHPDLDAAVLDPARFKQILFNLLSNAIKFTAPGGWIVVRTLPEGDNRFRLEVGDTGIGIRDEDLPRLFVEFSQLDAGASKRHAGTGLGLALTRRLAEAQGGTVGVRSTFGQGSTFHVTLPLRRPETTPAAGAAVLVIEEDARHRAWLVAHLEAAGYLVASASHAEEARRNWPARDFDAIVVDVLSPDGLDVLTRMGTPDRTVPIILVPVAAGDHGRFADRVAGVVQRPVAGAELLASLERAGVKPPSRGGVLVVEDDPQNVRLMEAHLTRLGYRPVSCSTAEGGLEALGRLAPVAIVLDVMLPETDGWGFVEKLRQIPEYRATPVLIWTVKDLSVDEERRLDDQTQGRLPKGQSHGASLLRELEAALGARPSGKI